MQNPVLPACPYNCGQADFLRAWKYFGHSTSFIDMVLLRPSRLAIV